jgi:hypothetical protein
VSPTFIIYRFAVTMSFPPEFCIEKYSWINHNHVPLLTVFLDFQLTFVPKQFDNERTAWKIIIHLNVIGYVLGHRRLEVTKTDRLVGHWRQF